MGDEMKITGIGAKPVEVQTDVPAEKTKTEYNIAGAMLASGLDDGKSIGVGVQAGANKKIPLGENKYQTHARFIDFKANAGIYTNGVRADVSGDFKIAPGTYSSRESYLTPVAGVEVKYVQNNSEPKLNFNYKVLDIVDYETSASTTYKQKNLQLNSKLGFEFNSKKLTFGAGMKQGYNFVLDDGYKLQNSYSVTVDDIQHSFGSIVAGETESGINAALYGNANYKLGKSLDVGVSGEYGGYNREILATLKYKF